MGGATPVDPSMLSMHARPSDLEKKAKVIGMEIAAIASTEVTGELAIGLEVVANKAPRAEEVARVAAKGVAKGVV